MPGSDSTPASPPPLKAVFLSYAREDSAAALRIADALRSHGLDVWFDQSELRGGDAWDQKIRAQIKECGLFMPVISTHTQARGEGYFRLEWKLAVERTHLMAEGVPFLAPVVVDGTAEGGAIVPPEFLRVQWTRLTGALPTPEFVAQVRRMLGNPAPRPATAAALTARPPAGARGPSWSVVAAVAVLAAAAVAYLLFRRPALAVAAVPAAPSPIPTSPAEAPVYAKSIAVLPFANMSEDKGNAYFADGVQEDVLTNLSYVHDLHLVSRTSVMQYRDTTKSIRQIGEELHVAYVLEGSVRREGNKVRVTGQLINAATDEHVWAQAYDRDLTDIFAIQGELAQAIANALQTVLAPETKQLIERRPTENAAAYDAYVKARDLRNSAGLANSKPVVDLLRSAVALDSNFAQAWGALASVLAFWHFGDELADGKMAEAKAALDNALRLAPDDPTVIEFAGDYYYYGFRDYVRATEQYLRLQALRPNDPEMFYSLGLIQRRQGRFADAVGNIRRALALDPANRSMRTELSDMLANLRHYDEASALMAPLLAAHPDDVLLRFSAADDEFRATGSTAAFAALRKLEPATPGEAQLYDLGLKGIAAEEGNWGEFLRLVAKQPYFEDSERDPHWSQDVGAAMAAAEFGDLEQAHRRAAAVLPVIQAELTRNPQNSQLWSNLALAQALLGHHDECLRSIAKERELMPESKDAILGPQRACDCAEALAWVGETDQALAESARLLRVPYGFNVHSMANFGGSLRKDPRYLALLQDPKNNAPLF